MSKVSATIQALRPALCIFALGVSLHASAAEVYTAPAVMAKNWATLARADSIGRIQKLEPWVKYESLSPCTISVDYCKILVTKLQVATVEVAKNKTDTMTWIVTIPSEQKLKVGDFMGFTFPATPKELAQAGYDKDGKVVQPHCSWGPAVADGPTEGVLCDNWRYTRLPFNW